MQRGDIPYQSLGKELQRIRTSMQESTAEVSGAVEIDMERLARFERGEIRPSEDILLLLITHFGIRDEAASRLWQLAGYDDLKTAQIPVINDENTQQQAMMILPLDSRIVYTDMVHVMVNNYGVVMNFMQTAVPNGQPLAVARVGMSLDHAKSVLDVLQKTIQEASQPKTPKSLQAPKSNHSRTDKK